MKLIILFLTTLNILCVNLKQDKPILMNATYEYPYRDIVEEDKYIEEHLRYIERVKQMEYKFTKDMDLLRMMYNVQNAQIQKLSEIIGVNAALIKQIEIKTLPKPETS